MSRLIDADRLRVLSIDPSRIQLPILAVPKEAIDCAQTIDQVKHGEWIGEVQYIGGFMAMECSNCHEIRIVDKYCPNCGSQMSNE